MSIEALREKLAFAEENPTIFDPIQALDKGFVRLVDWMGNDARVVQAARVSYGEGTKTVREDAGLIDYLIRNKHTSPLEMVVFTFHIKIPLFVFAQLVRHRMASLNAQSARYSVMKDEFYIPEEVRSQSETNKQGSGDYLEKSVNAFARGLIERVSVDSYEDYEYLLAQGVAREQARMVLPQNLYTEVYWKQDLHNLLHLLKLRLDNHAQQEIREYASAIYNIVDPIVPNALNSWSNHSLHSITLSETEQNIVRSMSAGISLDEALYVHTSHLSKRYTSEIREKIRNLFGVD